MKKIILAIILSLFIFSCSLFSKKENPYKENIKSEKMVSDSTTNRDIKTVYFVEDFVENENFTIQEFAQGIHSSYFDIGSYYVFIGVDEKEYPSLLFYDKEFNLEITVNIGNKYEAQSFLWDTNFNLYVINNEKKYALVYRATNDYLKPDKIIKTSQNLFPIVHSDKNNLKSNRISKKMKSLNYPIKEILNRKKQYYDSCYAQIFKETIETDKLKKYIKTLSTKHSYFFIYENDKIVFTELNLDFKELLEQNDYKNINNSTKINRIYIGNNHKEENSFINKYHLEVMGYNSVGANHFSFGSKVPYGHEFYDLIDQKDTLKLFTCKSQISVISEKHKIFHNNGTLYKLIHK